MALTYTFYQALAENALRNLAILCLGNRRDAGYVRRLGSRLAWLGASIIGTTLLLLWTAYGAQQGKVIVSLAPFMLVPFVTTAGILPVARLQFSQRWADLARFQLVAAFFGLVVSLSIVFTIQSSLAMALHVLTTEILFMLLCRYAARGVVIDVIRSTRNPKRETVGLSLVGVLGWSQSQLDRVFVGALGGAGTLGLYSTASTMGRSGGDALASAMSNHLRATVARLEDEEDRASAVRRHGFVALGAATVGLALVTVLVEFVLVPILGADWAAALHVVPLIAAATLPASVSWGLQMMAVANGRQWASATAGLVGVACCLPIGLLAIQSLQAAALMVVAREILVLAVCQVFGRVEGSRLPMLLAVGAAIAAASIFLFLPVSAPGTPVTP
ncbi:oligosaccharide flippase family protein [Kocuria flava]|uniref:oligosaccharide flippase family protein n=1 Tax=Kocuria flava TaxID=446860 RepID=UPI0015DEF434|nr:oligosaccharide flippase family protein [Kocuria flava]